MAVDSRNKRASAIGVGLESLRILPLADGTIGAADRQQLALCYAALVAAATTVVSRLGMALIFFVRRRRDDQ